MKKSKQTLEDKKFLKSIKHLSKLEQAVRIQIKYGGMYGK